MLEQPVSAARASGCAFARCGTNRTACTFVHSVCLACCVCEGVLLPVLALRVSSRPCLLLAQRAAAAVAAPTEACALLLLECWDSALVRPVCPLHMVLMFVTYGVVCYIWCLL